MLRRIMDHHVRYWASSLMSTHCVRQFCPRRPCLACSQFDENYLEEFQLQYCKPSCMSYTQMKSFACLGSGSGLDRQQTPLTECENSTSVFCTTSSPKYNLGVEKLAQSHGLFDVGVEYNIRALKHSVKQYSKDSINNFYRINDLAVHFDKDGMLQEAAYLYRRSLLGRMKIKGVDHPDTLMTMQGAGQCLSETRQLQMRQVVARAIIYWT